MGRYYNGDIDGKFWFGLQSSYDAEHFGGNHYKPETEHFEFFKEDLEDIKKGIEKCENILGGYEQKIIKYFEKNDGWTNELIAEHLEVNKAKAKILMKNYARVKLGRQILKCVEETGECCFEAEV